jgi:glycosyltransferase involved in cell wall biosynthesis
MGGAAEGILASIVMPCRNEALLIGTAIDSILACDLPPGSFELIVVDGRSSDATRAIVAERAAAHPSVRLLDNPQRTVPFAMNAGIRAARGRFVFRVDAHSSYPADYFSALLRWHDRLDAANVGGVCITDVARRTPTSLAIRTVLSDRLGVGNSLFRTGTDTVREVDTVPFGCYRREALERHGLYDERLTRNQDIELNKRIIRQGGRVFLVPDVTCTYFARETWDAFARNAYDNGYWNVLTAHLTGEISALSPRHFVPLGFVSGLLGGALLAPLAPWVAVSWGVGVLSYGGIVLRRALRITPPGSTPWHVCAAFALLHVAYGTGSLAACLRVLRSRLGAVRTGEARSGA